jgi:hypothetical protein
MPINPAVYKAAQDRVELLSRLILDTDDELLDEIIVYGEHADTIAPFVDPTAWQRGHDTLRMVIDHAHAIKTAKRAIQKAAERRGAIPAGGR